MLSAELRANDGLPIGQGVPIKGSQKVVGQVSGGRFCRGEKDEARARRNAGFEGKAGDGLLSHHLSVAVPSALQGLTAVFGMGTGVAPAR